MEIPDQYLELVVTLLFLGMFIAFIAPIAVGIHSGVDKIDPEDIYFSWWFGFPLLITSILGVIQLKYNPVLLIESGTSNEKAGLHIPSSNEFSRVVLQ